MIPDVISGKSKVHGKGAFAGRRFEEDEKILAFKGKVFNYRQTLGPSEGMFLQVGKNLYLGPSGEVDDLVNHSCSPNSYIDFSDDGAILRALVPIEPLTEITYDYSIFMNEDPWTMPCSCGSRECRKVVREFSLVPAEVRARYEELGIVPGFVLQGA